MDSAHSVDISVLIGVWFRVRYRLGLWLLVSIRILGLWMDRDAGTGSQYCIHDVREIADLQQNV